EPSNDYIDFETDQLGRQFGKPVEMSFRRSKLKSNVLPLDIPQIPQSLPKLTPKLFRIDIANDQCANGRHFRLLRVRRERPHSRRATKRDNQFSPLDVDCHVTLPRGVVPLQWTGMIPRFNRVVCGYLVAQRLGRNFEPIARLCSFYCS